MKPLGSHTREGQLWISHYTVVLMLKLQMLVKVDDVIVDAWSYFGHQEELCNEK